MNRHYCAAPDCPGLPWAASDHPHPPDCGKPGGQSPRTYEVGDPIARAVLRCPPNESPAAMRAVEGLGGDIVDVSPARTYLVLSVEIPAAAALDLTTALSALGFDPRKDEDDAP